jgi:Zn-dependent protease/CBS domain-containing protein
MSESDQRAGAGQDPFRASLPLGTVDGIKIRVNWSATAIFVLIAVGLAGWQFPAVSPHRGALAYALAGVLTTVVFLGSLLAHELAHSLVARRYGLTVRSITLWLLGGISELEGEAPRPSADAWIAGVGPLTSLVLGLVFVALALLVGSTHPARASTIGLLYFALAYLGITNLVIAVFNVIPAAPLDGGRLLRSVIWWRTRDRVRATVRADQVGQVFGTICIVGGLYLFFLTRNWSWIWIALIGWFLFASAGAEARQAVLANQLRGIRASQVMTPAPVTVPESMTVSEFLDNDTYRAHHHAFPVTRDGTDTATGLVTLTRINQVPAGQRGSTRLADIACPLADVATAAPEESVADLLPRLTACADRRALVFSHGQLAGIITPTDISRMTDRLARDQPRRAGWR